MLCPIHRRFYRDEWAGRATHFQHQDWLGTERLRTTYNGSVEGSFTSLPFGDGQGTSGSDLDPYHFAALDSDTETATDHAQFRQYNPAQGRWMRPDPYYGSYRFRNPQSLNRYSYVLNNPLSRIDPAGLEDEDEGPCDDGSCVPYDGGDPVDGGGDPGGGGPDPNSGSPSYTFTGSGEAPWCYGSDDPDASCSIPYLSGPAQVALLMVGGSPIPNVPKKNDPNYGAGLCIRLGTRNGWSGVGCLYACEAAFGPNLNDEAFGVVWFSSSQMGWSVCGKSFYTAGCPAAISIETNHPGLQTPGDVTIMSCVWGPPMAPAQPTF